MNIKLSAIAIAVIALAGCASMSSGPGAGDGSPPPSAPPPSPSAWPQCKSDQCVVNEISLTMVNTTVKDGSVINQMTCTPSSVTESASGTYTAKCTVKFSDGTRWRGLGNLITATDKVTWDPQACLSACQGY